MKRCLLLILIAAVLITAVFLSGCNNEKSVIDSIELYTRPVTVYLQGQELDLSGAQLLIKYDDNTEQIITVTPDMVSGYDRNLLGEQYVVIRFEGEIVSLPIKIVSPELLAIDIAKTPDKTHYIEGQLLDITGCRINADYVGGATQVIEVTESMCNLDAIDMEAVGTQVVTVSYSVNGAVRTTTFNIYIEHKVLQSMQITAAPQKTIYYVGESLDLTGGEIFMSYNSGYPERHDITELYNNGNGNLSFQWNNMTIAGRTVVTASYTYEDPTKEPGSDVKVFTATFDVSVTERDVAYVEILDTSTDAYRNQLLDCDINLTGLALRVTYNNGSSEDLVFTGEQDTDPMLNGRVEVEGYRNGISDIGYQTVNLVFYFSGVRLESTYALGINLNNKKVSNVRLILPLGTAYDPQDDMPCFYQDTPINPFANTELGTAGWKYVLVYDNGSESETEYDLVSSMFRDIRIKNGIYYPEVGTVTWEIRYNRLENLSFSFKILPKEIKTAALRFESGYKTYFGFDINVEGIMLDLEYNNGDTKSVYVSADMITEYDPDILGEQTIKVTYKDKYTDGIDVEGIVTVVKKVKADYSIGFLSLPTKINYTRDELLSLAGAKISIQYDEGGNAAAETVNWEDLATDWEILAVPLIEGAVTFRNGNGWTVTAFNIDSDWKLTEIDEVQVFVSYEGLTKFENGAGFSISVTDSIDSITLVSEFDDIYSGQALDLTEKYLQLNYLSGRHILVPITASMTDYNPRNLTVSERTITITYEGITTNFTIDVKEKVLSSMSVISLPFITEYLYRSGDGFNPEGLKLMLHYSNGSSDIVEITSDVVGFSFENFSTDDLGECQVSIVYGELQVAVTVNVRDVVPVSISWYNGNTAWPIVQWGEGKTFLPTEAITQHQIQIDNSDGTINLKTVAEMSNLLDVVGYSPNTAVKQHIKLVYKFNSALELPVEVDIIPRRLASISLDTSGKALRVIENNDFDLTEYKLVLYYSNNTQEIISMAQPYIVKNADNPGGYDKNDTRIGERTVTIRYVENGVACTIDTSITVNAKQLLSIGINTLPKLKYIEGEELNLSGGKVALYYDNGSQEELSMTDAVTSNFYINRNKFDNNEFSGVAKLQTIYIIYVSAGREFQTHFDIIMQDRRMPVVVFDPQNAYRFVYGTKQAPAFAVYGYSDYYQEEPIMVFDSSKLGHITVKYININEYYTQDPGKDYTVLPSEVGEYYIVVSYDADSTGSNPDPIHNSFIFFCPDNLVITKRIVYVVAEGLERIYGTANPQYTITIMSEEKYRNPTLVNDKPFAYDDDFYSPGFIRTISEQSYCYDKNNNLVTCFLVICLDRNGNPIDGNTDVGRYQISLSMGTSVSDNYSIVFIGNYFAIKPRDVQVTPHPVTVEYGDRNISFRYTVSGMPGDPATGLYGTDSLAGNLSRIDPGNYNVGRYAVTKGTLSNPNYNVVFVNETVSDGGANGVYVNIYSRKLYIKINSRIITYGDALPIFGMSDVTLYRDDVCTITEGALAATDTFAMLLGQTGSLAFSHNATSLSNVGKYGLTVTIVDSAPNGVIANYDISYISGFIEIKQRTINIAAVAAAKVYGDADPILSYTVSDYLPSVTLQGNVARQPGEYIGTYAINIGTLAASNNNYKINFTGASFVITSKMLVARIGSENLTKVFDGRGPAAPAFTVYQIVDGQELPVSDAVDTSFISVSIVDARRDSGSYNLRINNTNSNYTVSFPQGTSYKYVIEKKSVGVEIIIPQLLPYKGSGYVFDAYVPDNQIQRFYNSDGSVMLDENNNEIKDEVSAVLQFTTGSTAIYVGNYEVYVSALLSANDNYQIAGSISRTFTITPRELVVTLNPEFLSYGNTIEREYNNVLASIQAANYTVSNKIANSSDITNFSLRIISQAQNLDSAKNVIFKEDGTIDSYDVVIVQPSNPNYTVSLAAPYKYKITPKTARITIANNFLRKNYDGNSPEITDFSKVATLAKADVVFTFERDINDGRPLGSAGVYNVSAASKDPNHTIYLAQAYQYTVLKRTVTVSLQNDFKYYDGETIRLTLTNLNIGSYKGITPVVRSFSGVPIYNQGEITGYQDVEDVFTEFTSTMVQMTTKFFKNIEKGNNIIISTDLGLANLRVNETKNTIQEALAYLNANSFVIQTSGNLAAVTAHLNSANAYLDAILASSNETVRGSNLYLAKKSIEDAYNIIEAENTYIAFLFRPASSGANEPSIDAGSYSFEIRQNDFNKDYYYNSTLYTYRILPKDVYLGVNTYSKVYGTITSNPVHGSADYYDFETTVLVNGVLVEMTLPNFNPEFTRTNPGSFNVGTYSIIFIRDSELDNNYVIVEDRGNYSWQFVITPATITLQVDDTGFDEDKVYYGTRITNIVVDRWSYVAGLSAGDQEEVSVGGIVSHELLIANIININNVSYSAYKITGTGELEENDIISDLSSKPSSGEYSVSAEGFSAGNYSFTVLPGRLKISKADITIITDYSNNVQRIYGEALILSFDGLEYTDSISISYNYDTGEYEYDCALGENGGSFTMPQRLFDAGDYAAGFNPYALTSPVTNINNYIIHFGWTPEQANALGNYNLTGITDGGGNPIEYGMLVQRATLTFSVSDPANINLDPSGIYGELPSITYTYAGFKNGETQSSLGFANPDHSALTKKHNWDSQTLTLQDFMFSVDAQNRLSNYTINIAPSETYTVIKRNLYVYLDKDIYVKYNAGVSITPYINKIYQEGETHDEHVFSIISGQYGFWNFVFDNKPKGSTTGIPTAGLTNGETPELIFSRYTAAEGAINETSQYVYYDYMYKHGLEYTAQIGEGAKIKLKDLVFMTYGADYEIVYCETTLNVYGQLTSLEMDTEAIVLQGDTIDNFSVIANFEDGTWRRYTYAELKALPGVDILIEPEELTTVLNKNSSIKITLNRNYTLTPVENKQFTFLEPEYDEEGNLTGNYINVTYYVTADSSFPSGFSNAQKERTINTRLYGTQTTQNNVTLSGYTYRNMADASNYTSGAMLYLSGGNAYYDYIDTSFRLVPTKASHGFALYFGGGVTAGGPSTLIFSGSGTGVYRIEMTSPAAVYPISLGDIDLFDGYTHNIRIYFNKQYKMVHLFVDGYACGAIDAGQFEFDTGEYSLQRIGLYGAKAWIRHMVTGFMGYKDRIATQVEIAESLPLAYYLTSTETGKELDLKTILASSGVPLYTVDPEYTIKYYVNGVETVGGAYFFEQGTQKVELRIIDDLGQIVDKRSVLIVITYASLSASVTEITSGSTLIKDNINQSNPAVIKSFTPNGTNPDRIDNLIQEQHSYRFDASNTDYTALSMSLSMNVAKMASTNEYRATSNAKSVVVLWGNNPAFAPGPNMTTPADYYGISLSYEYNATNQTQVTRLYVAFGATQFYEQIPDIDWISGKEYTLQLYIDKLSANDYGNMRAKFLIYEGSSLFTAITLEAGYGMSGGTISLNQINSLVSASSCKASIISTDTIITVNRVDYNPQNKAVNDYLVNGVYTQSSAAGVPITGTSFVHISSNTGTYSVNKIGVSSVKFQFTPEASINSVNFMFMIASTDSEYTLAKSLYVQYIGAERKLYFFFVENGTEYKKQLLADNLNLVDGQPHTIVAKLGNEKINSSSLIGTLLAGDAPSGILHQSVSIKIDGVESFGKMPYYNYTYFWLRQDGSNSIGGTPPTSGGTFMDSYIFCGLELYNAPIYLYSLESGAKSNGQYVD